MVESDFVLTEPRGDGEGNYPRVARTLSNVLCGNHSLVGMEHRHRVEFLYGLQETMRAMLRVGWIEHTNDWDWEVSVTLEDGTKVGADWSPDDDEVLANCDTFELVAVYDQNHEIAYQESDHELKRVEYLELEVEHVGAGDGGRYNPVRVRIDDIAAIHIMGE